MIDIKNKLTKRHYQILSAVLGTGILVGVIYGAYNIAHEARYEVEAIATPSEATKSTISTIVEVPETKEIFVPSADKLNLAFCFPEGVDETDPLNSYAGEVYKELMTEDNEYLANIYDSAGVSPRALAGRMGIDSSRVMGKYNPSAQGQNPDDPSTWFIPNFKNVNVSFYNADGKRVNEYSNVKDIMSMASVYCYAHNYLDVETFKKYCEELYDKSRSYTISIGNVYYDDGCINRSAKEEAEEAHKMEKALAELKQSLLEDAMAESYEAAMSRAAESAQDGTNSESEFGSLDGNVSESVTYDSSSISETYSEAYVDSSSSASSGDTSSGESIADTTGSGDMTDSDTVSVTDLVNSSEDVTQSAASSDAAVSETAAQDAAANSGNIVLGASKFLGSLLSVKDMFKATNLYDRVEAETFSGYEGIYYGRPGNYGTAREYTELLKAAKRSESAELTSVTAFVSADSTEASSQTETTESAASDDATTVETAETTSSETVLSENVSSETTTDTTESETEGTTDSREKYAKYKAGQGIDIINNPSDASEEEAVETAEASTEGKETIDSTDEAEPENDNESTSDGVSESGDSTSESGDDLEENAGRIVLGTFTRDELLSMDDATLLSLLEESMEAEEEKQITNDETDVNSKKYCPGHVDLYVKVTIFGFEDEKGLKTIDLSADDQDENEAAKTLEAALAGKGWNGWTEERCNEVQRLINQDWFKTYGLSISTINPKNPLTEEEISKYLDGLPDDISKERKAVIKFALESVGKVPYYWGGKASGKNYEINNFGSIVESDYRGRVLRGLDCSGWIQWVYWSAIGDNLNGSYSTSSLIGEGEKINRADLQPGDIIIRTGADSHVVMFIGWAGNGNMIAIHENSGANNVSVNEVTANYPYYRKLIN